MKDPVQTGIEVQVSNSCGDKEWTNKVCAGATYDLTEPGKNQDRSSNKFKRALKDFAGKG